MTDVYPEYWPAVGLQHFMLGKLEWTLEHTDAALAALKDAARCLTVTHPQGCPLLCDLYRLLHDVETERGFGAHPQLRGAASDSDSDSDE